MRLEDTWHLGENGRKNFDGGRSGGAK